jgi:DNA-binding NarL/FixJ family response regulator
LIRVGVVTSNPALRIGLREILNTRSDFELIGEAATLEEWEAVQDEVDVLVVAAIPASDGQISLPEAAVLLLTEGGEETRLLAGRASSHPGGMLPLNASETEIGAAITALSEGLWVGAPGLISTLIKRPNPVELSGPEVGSEAVTQREMDVLQCIAQGLANKQIAISLGISEHTVKFHLSSLYAKLGATNRTEAVRIGMQRGLVVL